MNVNINEFDTIDLSQFRDGISSDKEVTISFPIPSIGFSSSRIDIINDLRDVSFCCEKVADFINVIDFGFVTRDRYYTDFQIKCCPTDIDELIKILIYSCRMLGVEDVDEEDRFEFMDLVSDYEEGFDERLFTFPDLINDYWANLINGAYWEIASEYHESEDEFFRNTYKKYPEHRFGFWRSAKSKVFKDPIYFSIDSWIIPPGTNLRDALRIYSGLNSTLVLEAAEKVEYNGKSVLLTNNAAVYFKQEEQLRNAIICSQKVLVKKLNADNNQYVAEDRKTNNCNDISIKRGRRGGGDKILDASLLSFMVSECGDLIVANYQGFNHVFFEGQGLTFEEIKGLDNHLYPAYAKTQNLIANSISGNFNWVELNDETFEELCYDILYCHPKFDSTTIQKMGKSKSRDGGRDILIKTKKTPTNKQKLYIFQCKYLLQSASLSASRIPDAANVIMQYGAKGYGVFTTGVIDATLFDMLDGFTRNSDIDTGDRWSKYELERYLCRHQSIKNKYFGRRGGQ